MASDETPESPLWFLSGSNQSRISADRAENLGCAAPEHRPIGVPVVRTDTYLPEISTFLCTPKTRQRYMPPDRCSPPLSPLDRPGGRARRICSSWARAAIC